MRKKQLVTNQSPENLQITPIIEFQSKQLFAIKRILKKVGLGSAGLELLAQNRTSSRSNRIVKRPALPLGWIIAKGARPRGFLGNVPVRMRLGDKGIVGAAMRAMGVEPGFTSSSFALLARFLAQTQPKVFLNTSANRAICPLLLQAGFKPIPQPYLNQSLFWILQARQLLLDYLRGVGLPSAFSKIIANLGAPLLKVETVMRQRKFHTACRRAHIVKIKPENLNQEFDRLWLEFAKKNPGKLLTDRSQGSLRWHFSEGNKTILHPHIFAYRSRGKLCGYLATGVETSPRTGIRRCRVVDLVVPSGRKIVIRQLLQRAYTDAIQSGSHLFELTGFSGVVRQVALQANPYVKKYDYPRFWYATGDPALDHRLRKARSWYTSPFDGDATL